MFIKTEAGMRLFFFLYFLHNSITCMLFMSESDSECDKTVTVQHGTIKGYTTTSVKGRPICSFTGIPYAQPPIGDLRFKEPQPLKPWEGVLDVTKDTPQCLHLKLFSPVVTGQEDCLYLNVFTPRLSAGPDGKLLDVLLFIFPGEFYFGTSSRKIFDPGYLGDMDVILVTFSYRLGAFGYFSTGDDEAPGNYGMKDQVTAMRWVRDNIQQFGGNASSVTLFGHSAGAASVHLHLLSPLSKGLFIRAISMEGSALNPWARCPKPLEQAQKQANAMNCPTEPTDKLVACLRAVDATALQRSILKLFPWLVFPSPGYAPVVETKSSRNPEPFLIEEPIKLIKDGNFQKVPWLVGGNSEPAALFIIPLLKIKPVVEALNTEADKIYKYNLMMWVSVPEEDVDTLSHKVVLRYMGTNPGYSGNNSMQMIDMISDRLLTHGVYKAAMLHSKVGHHPIYKYFLSYRALFSGTELTAPTTNYGTSHGDELQYFFFSGKHRPELPGHPDNEVREMLLTLWTNFAKYGNPTPTDSAEHESGLMKGLVWKPVKDEHLSYLHIGQKGDIQLPSSTIHLMMKPPVVQMSEDLFGDRMRFWDSLPLSENV